MHPFLQRLRHLLPFDRSDHDLREEMELHRAMRQEQLERSGLSTAEAYTASRRALGNVTLAHEDARAIWGWRWLEGVIQDVRYAWRLLARGPGFALAVVAVTALGIGGTVAIGTLLDALVLRSLPVSEPSRLVYLGPPSFSYPVFQQLRARGGGIFEDVFAWNLERMNVQWDADIEPADVLLVSGTFHPTLGLRAAAGRLLTPDDDRIGGGGDGVVAVISHAAWRRRFDGQPGAIGRTIRIDRTPVTIVGVAPPGFYGVAAGLAPEVTLPLLSLEQPRHLQSATSSWLHLMGRLRPDVTLAGANGILATLWPAILEGTAPSNLSADRRASYLARRATLENGRTGFSRVRRRFAEPLWLLLGLVGLLMLIACASTANLLLARTAARRREIAVRLAIGAGRGRVLRQLLTETLVWTVIGTAAGVLLASWAAGGLVAMLATSEEPLALDVALTARTLLFAFALALVTATACAMVPGWRLARGSAGAPFGMSAHGDSPRMRRWSLNTTLVVIQVACAIVLVAGAAVFVRSLRMVLSEDAGFERRNLLVVATDPAFAGYDGVRLDGYYEQLAGRLAAIPGVESASVAKYPPLTNDLGAWTEAVRVAGAADSSAGSAVAHLTAITPAHFRTLGVPLLDGRDFTAADGPSSPAVVIISQSLARRCFGDASPLGRRIVLGSGNGRRELDVIGVVRDTKYQYLQETRRDIAYLPSRQVADVIEGDNLFVQVRTAGTPATVGGAIRAAIRTLDPSVPFRIETVEDRVRESVVIERVLATLASTLGFTALALACSSLFGLLAYAVTRRTREIGVRMALGASRREVVRMVLRDALVIAVPGMLLGLGATLAVGRFARTLLFEVTPSDPPSLAAAVAIVLAVALAASALPARRAAQVEPMVALRED
jgi:predicted permease